MKAKTWWLVAGVLVVLGGWLLWPRPAHQPDTADDERAAVPSAREKLAAQLAGTPVPLRCTVVGGEGKRAQAYLKFVGASDPVIVAMDANGSWQGTLPAGSYTVIASAGDWLASAALEIEVPLAAGAACELRLDTKGVLISGRVVDATGAPIAHASIDATSLEGTLQNLGAEAGAALADATGQFSLVVRPGALRLRGMHAAFAATSMLIHVSTPRTDIVLALQPGSSIAGTVLGGNDQPQAGAIVTLAREQSEWSKVVTAEADGTFEFIGIGPGAYGLTAVGGAYVTASPTVVELDNFESIADLKLVLTTGYAISGRVVDDDGKPVANAIVARVGMSGHHTADAQGRFQLDGVPPGATYVYAQTLAGGGGHPVEVAVTDRDVTDVLLKIDPVYTLRGRVDPPQAAMVWPSGAQDALSSLEVPMFRRAVQTDAQGAFVLEGVAPGATTIWARGTSGSLGNQTVVVSAATAGSEIVVAMESRGSISGQVVDGLGQPQAYARIGVLPTISEAGRSQFVRFVVNDGEFRSAESLTDAAGNFSLIGLRAGEHILRVADAQGNTLVVASPARLTLADAEVKSAVKVVVRANDKAIAVTVVDVAGAPVAEAWVRVQCDPVYEPMENVTSRKVSTGRAVDFGQPPRATNAAGRVVFEGLPSAALCEVTASSGNGTSFANAAKVSPGASITLTLKGKGALEGTIEPYQAGVAYRVSLRGADGLFASQSVVTPTFTMRGLAAGVYEAQVTASKVGRAVRDVSIAPGKTTVASFAIQANGIIKGRLVDAAGKPRAGVGVWAMEHLDAAGNTALMLNEPPPLTDAKGGFALPLPPAIWTPVEIGAGGPAKLVKSPVTLGSGQVVEVGDVQAN